MNQEDYKGLIELVYVGGGYIPHNDKAKEFSENKVKGEIIPFKEATQRDVKFHRCYFSLLNFIYEYLPSNFKEAVTIDKFYIWLKHLKGEYTVCFTFKDGTKLVEYDSISFGRMSQDKFETTIKEQLPWIYENVIGAFYEGDIYNGIIETIEEEYKKFLSKL
jgi:hypothetical protein